MTGPCVRSRPSGSPKIRAKVGLSKDRPSWCVSTEPLRRTACFVWSGRSGPPRSARGPARTLSCAIPAALKPRVTLHALVGRSQQRCSPVQQISLELCLTAAASAVQSLMVIDASRIESCDAAILGSMPAGSLPREMAISSDSRTLFVVNTNSKNLEVIDLARLPVQIAPTSTSTSANDPHTRRRGV
jgi:hypothetical protein